MTGIPFYPFFSTTYSDTFGYNEREGLNPHTFRNRYMNAEYQGSLNSGPTRFAAPYHGPPSIVGEESMMSGRKESMNEEAAVSFPPTSSTSTRTAPRQLDPIRSAPLPSSFSHSARSWQPHYDQTFPPSSTSFSSSQPVPFSSSSRSHATPYPPPRPSTPAQSIPFSRLHASTRYDIVNKEIELAMNTMNSRGGLRAPGLSKPFNDYEVSYNKPGPTFDKSESARHCGSLSITRRLPEGERLRYHVPGYMGFVRSVQFRHGDTYGKTTRKAILGFPDYA